MDARAQTVRGILHSPVQYLIPFFQRHYSWRKQNWERLLGDLWTLLDDGEADSQHFMGPLVCTPMNLIPGEVPRFQLIDGQQRLTTLTILLAALRDVAKDMGVEELVEDVTIDYLVLRKKKDLQRFKVIPRIGDREVLAAVIDGKIEKQQYRQPVAQAWRFFRQAISEWATDDVEKKLRRLFVTVTERLALVVITIDGENPYEIFESLNSTGLPLEESDLIRNFLFMQVPVEDQDGFNTRHWQPFDRQFEQMGEFTAKDQTKFYRTYLMRNGLFSKPKCTFVEFKRQNRQRGLKAEEQIQELTRFGRFATILERPQTCEDASLRNALTEIAALDISTAHPLILNLLDRHSAKTLGDAELLACLRDLASFVLRRSVCGESTRNYGRWFCEAAAAIGEQPEENLRSYWLRRGWPDDRTFVARLIDFPLFHREHKKCRLILERLERSHKHKEPVEFAKLSIEHVMPQTIDQGKSAKAWKDALGANWKAEQQQWLHTLGNLTLTAYNPDLGNRPYAEKQEIFEASHLELNKYFEKVAPWNSAEIRNRGEQLATKVASLWTRPTGGEYQPIQDSSLEPLSRHERRQRCLDYWTALLDYVKQRGQLRRLPKAMPRGWIGFPIGKSWFRILAYLTFSKRTIGVALSCTGPKGLDRFLKLQSQRDEIEAKLGMKLLWEELVFGKSSHITIRLTEANPASTVDWPRQHEWFATTIEKFHAVFSSLCKSLDDGGSSADGGTSRRERFWRGLLERAASRTSLHSGLSSGDFGWIATGSGKSGLTYVYVLKKDTARVELYIDRGKGCKAENEQIFDAMFAQRAKIEADFGGELRWERLDNRRCCRVSYRIELGGVRNDESEWPAIQEAMIDAMIRLEKSLAPWIASVD
jgi:uncharacterized protein with ParB-like and HNH nuclease domain